MSQVQNTAYRVPQGSILDPILFNIYANGITENITDCTLVHDDTQFLHASLINNLDLLLIKTEATLLNINQYFLKNSLMMNPAKTQCIFLGNRQILSHIPTDTVLHFDGEVISPSTHVKSVGVYMDRYMLFDVPVN